jgi:hypothetical protein
LNKEASREEIDGKKPAHYSHSNLRDPGGAGDRPDVREHAPGVPGWEGSYERRGALELDAVPTGGLGPGEPARVPFDEGFGVCSDIEILVEAGVRLADFGIPELDE